MPERRKSAKDFHPRPEKNGLPPKSKFFTNKKGKKERYTRKETGHTLKDGTYDDANDYRRKGHKAKVVSYYTRDGSWWNKKYAIFIKEK